MIDLSELDDWDDDAIGFWTEAPTLPGKLSPPRFVRLMLVDVELPIAGHRVVLMPNEPITFEAFREACISANLGISHAASWLACRIAGYRFMSTNEAVEA